VGPVQASTLGPVQMSTPNDPELWINALAVNSCRQAVPLEAALDLGLEVLPELIIAAIGGVA
jgi:hypothetical protein